MTEAESPDPDPELVREIVGQMPHPLASDTTPYGKWIRTQAHRRDPVGALARVASQDPTWPGGKSRAELRSYFESMGARDFVLDALKRSWDEFEVVDRRDRARDKNKAKRQQRAVTKKAQRPKKKRKR